MGDQPLWQEQCDAARTIKAHFGADKAMGYLLGEKLLRFVRAADADPALQPDLAGFVAEARAIFTAAELRRYFTGPRAVGALGHVLDPAGREAFGAAGALQEDPVGAAHEAIGFERMRQLLGVA